MVLTVVVSTGVLLVALVVATALVLRAVRGSGPAQRQPPEEHEAAVRLERSVGMLAELSHDMQFFARSVQDLAEVDTRALQESALMLRDLQPTMASGSTEVSESRIVAELNHALQTPLRGLNYAVRNLESLPPEALVEERAKRVADMAAMLDNCTSALATFRGLASAVAAVPVRQPSLDKAVRAFSDSMASPGDAIVRVEVAGLPDQVEGFSNHYLLTMLQPLVENAIEGCAPGGTVEITCVDHGDEVEFAVANPVDRPVDEDVLFAPKQTTKDGHQGLGVSIALRLAEFERGELTADVTDAGVRMRIVLPRR